MPKAYWVTTYRSISDPDKLRPMPRSRRHDRAVRRALSRARHGGRGLEAGQRSAS